MKITPIRVFVFSVIALLGLVSAVVVLQEFFTGPAPSDQRVDGKPEKDPSTITEPVASVPSPDEASEPPEDLSPEKEEVVKKERQFRKGVAKQANRPLEFYGKVVDQAGQAVPGVQIQARIAYHQGIWVPELKQEVFYVRTDAKGRFAITNQKGTNLYIEKLHKKGYISEVGPTSFKAHYLSGSEKTTPEPPYDQDPVVFKIWKKPEPADLIRGREGFHFNPSAGYQIMNIPGTDQSIRVRFNRKEVGSPFNSDSWNVSVKIENGGIQETEQLYLLEAPTSGYKNKWQHQELSDGKDFSSNLERKFFVKLGNGAGYASLKMDFRPYYGNTMENLDSYIGCRYRVNPHGSRNLLGKYD